MDIRKQMQKEHEKDTSDMFTNDLGILFATLYKKHISKAIKRGIRAKKLKNQL